jgi:hypothetical protein
MSKVSHTLSSLLPPLPETIERKTENTESTLQPGTTSVFPRTGQKSGRLPSDLTAPPSERARLQALTIPVNSPARVIINKGHTLLEELRPNVEALIEVRKDIREHLGATRQAVLADPKKRLLNDDYRRWRDAPAGSTEEESCKTAGEKAQASLALEVGHGQNELHQTLRGTPLEKFLCPWTGGFRDPKTGLVAKLMPLPPQELKTGTNTNEANKSSKPVLQLCFPGTGTGAAWRAQLKANVMNFLGLGLPAAYLQALDLARLLEKELGKTHELTFAGHSLGGGVATFVGAAIGAERLKAAPATTPETMKVLTVNPAGLGGASMDYLEKHHAGFHGAEGSIVNLRIKGDPVSSPKMQQRLVSIAASFFSQAAVPLRTPRALGALHEIGTELLAKENRSLPRAHRLEALASVFDLKA